MVKLSMSETLETLPAHENGANGGLRKLFRIISNALIPTIIVGGGLLAFLALRWMKEGPQRETRVAQPPLVSTVELQPGVESFPIRVHGLVAPKREVTIAAEVSGRIVEKNPHCRAGMLVNPGEQLFQIEGERYQFEVDRLTAEISQAQSDIQQLKVEEENLQALLNIAQRELKLAQRELDRFEKLVQTNVATESQRDSAEAAVVKAQNALRTIENNRGLIPARRERLEAQIRLNTARYNQATLDKDKTIVNAPFRGIVAAEGVEEGDFAQMGQMLVKLEDVSLMEVKCNLRPADLYWLRTSRPLPLPNERAPEGALHYEIPHASATITYQLAGRTYTWKGTLSRFEGVGIDEDTRTIPCRVEVDPIRKVNGQPANDGGPTRLMRGMFVNVELQAAPKNIALLQVPHVALRPGDQVWTVNNGQLQVHKVEVAKILPEVVLINSDTSGLRPGDRVVVSPLPNGFDGMHVRVEGQAELASK